MTHDAKHSIGAKITPLVITYNEEQNIGRTLATLHWANRVVVLDSGSTDATARIARTFANVDWRSRAFDSFKGQYEYGIHSTDIDTEYILALDADMSMSPEAIEEIERRFLTQRFDGGIFSFCYCIMGHPLSGSLYPAQTRLFRRNSVSVIQVGHGHSFEVAGSLYRFGAPLLHDDRKPIERWLSSQISYSAQEAERLSTGTAKRWHDWPRRRGIMPLLVFLLAYLKAGGPLKGASSLRYAYECTLYESLLAIRLLSASLANDPKTAARDSMPCSS